MGRGEELSDFQRGRVVGCHLAKKSVREISALLKMPRSTVGHVIRRWKHEGITTALPRSGRPHKLKEEDRQVLEKMALKNCPTSVEALTAEFQSVSGARMQNRMAVVLCNLKPAKRRGVLSQAAVLCARSPDRSEILDPPRRAAPGAKVTAQGFPGEPDTELTPRQKVWKQIQPDLRTDSQCVATYRGSAFEITGMGVCKAQTMSNSEIK
ncbi:hypothetical protein PBY51_019899 [Eleginops maclovinus]|uniref:Uncharacterized protein n=1 Tax=Eleginops maclovinus TaxID=56733 RepID=A0AAN8ASJ3_ELEMC|nr:hypothetical protein PBY51_019899 [Eleginops maclovinus]